MTQPSIVGPSQEHTGDPVLSQFPFPLRRRFYPLGFALDLETNSPDLMQAAIEGWSGYSPRFDDGPVRIALGVLPGESVLPPKSTFRARGHMMSLVADPDNFVVCDFDQHYAFGWVTECVARDYPLLRYRFLTSTANMLIEQLALAAVHGALVARNGCGVLLAGESFAGKSTLAYACARAGWTYICDDGTMLVRKHSGRYAVGNSRVMHFRPDARELFPELADHLPVARPNGKIGLEVLTRDLPIATAAGCSIDHVVFLQRGESAQTALRPYPPRIAKDWFEQTISFGTDTVREAQRQCFERLLSARIWELRYRDLDSAIGSLERLVDLGH